MYICVCNAIRECELRKAARLCPGDAEGVYAALGKKPNCGSCLDEAQDIIEAEREEALAPETIAA